MGLDVWFRDDVSRILQSANTARELAMQADDVMSKEMKAYYRGYAAALAVIAEAFGLVAAPMQAVNRHWEEGK